MQPRWPSDLAVSSTGPGMLLQELLGFDSRGKQFSFFFHDRCCSEVSKSSLWWWIVQTLTLHTRQTNTSQTMTSPRAAVTVHRSPQCFTVEVVTDLMVSTALGFTGSYHWFHRKNLLVLHLQRAKLHTPELAFVALAVEFWVCCHPWGACFSLHPHPDTCLGLLYLWHVQSVNAALGRHVCSFCMSICFGFLFNSFTF